MDEIDKFKRAHAFKPAGYKLKWVGPAALDYFLCEPRAILAFDLNELTSQSDFPKFIETSKRVVRSGSMDGLCFYFRVIFDDEISFDTSPLRTNTRASAWGNRFFRMEGRNYEIGEDISYRLSMEDILRIEEWSVSVKQE